MPSQLRNRITVSAGIDPPNHIAANGHTAARKQPAIIGGRRLKVAATLAYDEFLNTLNWPLGATVAVLLLIANVVIIVGCNRLVERRYKQVFE